MLLQPDSLWVDLSCPVMNRLRFVSKCNYKRILTDRHANAPPQTVLPTFSPEFFWMIQMNVDLKLKYLRIGWAVSSWQPNSSVRLLEHRGLFCFLTIFSDFRFSSENLKAWRGLASFIPTTGNKCDLYFLVPSVTASRLIPIEVLKWKGWLTCQICERNCARPGIRECHLWLSWVPSGNMK